MIELADCGKELLLTFNSMYGIKPYQACVKPNMIIKASRGTLTLFDFGYLNPDTQCNAIKSFMEEHRYDTEKAHTKDSNPTS